MQLYYEEENINNELNRMNEVELMSNHTHDLMDRLREIRRLGDEEYFLTEGNNSHDETLAHAEHMLYLATYGMGYPYTYADRKYWREMVERLKEKK